MLMSYWDGGYVTARRHRPASDPKIAVRHRLRGGRPGATPVGQITPEGNAHQAEFTRDNEFFFATDEDFDPFRVVGARSPAARTPATEFTAIQAGDAKPIDNDDGARRATRGSSASPARRARPGRGRAARRSRSIERGVCDFQVKVDLAKAAGYTSADRLQPHGRGRLRDAGQHARASTDIPAIFVSRTDGFRHPRRRRSDGYTCDTTAAATGTADAAAGAAPSREHLRGVRRLGLHAHVQAPTPTGAKLTEVAIYAPPENQDPRLRRGLRRPDRARGGDRSGREPGLRLALRARHARARATTTRASRRSARSSRRAARTTGASRCTSSAARRTSSAPTATAACGSSSTSRATSATASSASHHGPGVEHAGADAHAVSSRQRPRRAPRAPREDRFDERSRARIGRGRCGARHARHRGRADRRPGRQGRSWVTPTGDAIAASLVLRDYDELLPLRAGLAVADVAGAGAR